MEPEQTDSDESAALTDAAGRAREVEDLWSAFARSENRRVPLTFFCDEQVWLKVCGRTFREFYLRPDVQFDVQLKGLKWFSENVVGDMLPGPPQRWRVCVRLWMEEDEFFGCDVVYQEDDYAWAKPLAMGRAELLDYLSELDPEERVRSSRAFRTYQALRELAEGRTFLDRPVVIVQPGTSTHGIFTKAAEVRGIEQILLDIYEAPGFVEKYLRLVTEKTIGRIRAWHKLTTGSEPELPRADAFSFCDDSLQLISAGTYERFVLPCHERLCSAMTTGRRAMHLCGRAAQHYELIHDRLGVRMIDGPGPFVDHGHYLRKFGPDFAFSAQTDNAVLATGSPADVEGMVRGLMTPGARAPGRFQVMGFVTGATPLENVRACYAAARRYGVIARREGELNR